MPLGLMPGMGYEEKEIILGAGEAVLFYTDGLGFRVGIRPRTPSNLNLERVLGECLPPRTETESKGRSRCDGMISAASSEGMGALQGEGTRPS